MGSPPIKYTKNGRVNSKGIQILYLADSEKTIIARINQIEASRLTFKAIKDVNRKHL